MKLHFLKYDALASLRANVEGNLEKYRLNTGGMGTIAPNPCRSMTGYMNFSARKSLSENL